MAEPITLPWHADMVCTVCGLPLRCWGLDDYIHYMGSHILTGKYICKAGHKHQKKVINLELTT